MNAVSATSWLVAPQWTNRAASGSSDRTRSVSAFTSGIAGVPARKVSRDSSAASKSPTLAAFAITSAAPFGITSNRDSMRARATSKSSIARRMERSENTSASASVVARLSIRRMSDIEEYRLAIRAQPDLEIPDVRFRPVRHQRIAAILRYQREDRITLIGRLIGEIDTSVKLLEQPAGEKQHVQMRSLFPHAPRLNRIECANAVFFRAKPAEAAIFAGGVRLPYFQHGIVNQSSIAIEYSTGQMDTIAFRGLPVWRETQMEKRPDGLRWCRIQFHVHSNMLIQMASLRGPATQCRNDNQARIPAERSPGRSLPPDAASPSRPESIVKPDRRASTDRQGNTFA